MIFLMEQTDQPVLMDIQSFQFNGQSRTIIEIEVTNLLELVRQWIGPVKFRKIRFASFAWPKSLFFGLFRAIKELYILPERKFGFA